MMIRKALVAVASAGLLLGSTAAVAQADEARTSSPVAETEQAGMSSIGWVLALLVAAGVALVVIDDDDTDDAPTSP